MGKSLQLSVIWENLVTLSKEITYLELFNTFLITQTKTPKEVGHQSYVIEIVGPFSISCHVFTTASLVLYYVQARRQHMFSCICNQITSCSLGSPKLKHLYPVEWEIVDN